MHSTGKLFSRVLQTFDAAGLDASIRHSAPWLTRARRQYYGADLEAAVQDAAQRAVTPDTMRKFSEHGYAVVDDVLDQKVAGAQRGQTRTAHGQWHDGMRCHALHVRTCLQSAVRTQLCSGLRAANDARAACRIC